MAAISASAARSMASRLMMSSSAAGRYAALARPVHAASARSMAGCFSFSGVAGMSADGSLQQLWLAGSAAGGAPGAVTAQLPVLGMPLQMRWMSTESAGGSGSDESGEYEARKIKIDATVDYYRVLGVGKRASAADIKSAFRQLAKVHHPDVRHADEDPDLFKQINDAYAVLSDAGLREMYDAALQKELDDLRLRNEAGHGGFTVVGDEMFRKSMFKEGERYRMQAHYRGQMNRQQRVKVELPTRKQTYWRWMFPVSICALWAFNWWYFAHNFGG